MFWSMLTDKINRREYHNGDVIWNKLLDEIRMANDVFYDFKWRYKQSILNPLFKNAISW